MTHLTSDAPEDIDALEASVKSVLADDLIVAHLNAAHAYTIPVDSALLAKPAVIRGLQREHAAIHAQQVTQEHLESGRGKGGGR